MTIYRWVDLPQDSAALFNPALLALLLRRGAEGSIVAGHRGLPWEYAYIILPYCLDAELRKSLPTHVTTQLVTWSKRRPTAISTFPPKAKAISGLVRGAIEFGLTNGILALESPFLAPGPHPVKKSTASSSDEVSSMQRKAIFLGRWLPQSEINAATMNFFGIMP